ncbi:hypothetical protein SH528x_005776 [Novipirellula sp. SH528]
MLGKWGACDPDCVVQTAGILSNAARYGYPSLISKTGIDGGVLYAIGII